MKHINALTIGLVIAAVVFVCVLMFIPGSIGITESEQKYVDAYFNPDKVNTVSINISESDWQDMLENPLEEEFHTANITINGDTYQGIGIRTKGMTSLSSVASSDSDRYSFKIKADEYVGGQNFLGLDEFVLNNNYQDASYMKEYLSYALLTEMGVPTPLYTYAAVYLNGEYWGLYLMVEAVEEDFAARNFGMDYGELYKPESMNFGGGGMGDGKGGRGGMMGGIDDEMLAKFAEMDQDELEEAFKNFMNMDSSEQKDLMQSFGDMSADEIISAVNGTKDTTSDSGTKPSGGMQKPDGDSMPQMGDGQDFSNMQKPDGDSMPQMGDGQDFSNMQPPGGDMPSFGGSGGGCDLVYTDDEISSYSQIFDNAVFTVKKADKKRVIEALKNLNEGTNLETYVDVDEVLRYFAVNTALVNLDSYVSSLKHNYYLYEEDGQLSMIPWDWNLSFGAFQGGGSSSIINFPIDTPVTSGIELSQRPMIGSLLAVDEYKELYHQYLLEIVTKYFGTLSERIDKIDAMISSYVETDPTAFYSYSEYQSNLEYLKKFGELRAESIQGQLDGTIPATWDEQNADSSKLVDASSLPSSGGFGMPGGDGGFGGKNHGSKNK